MGTYDTTNADASTTGQTQDASDPITSGQLTRVRFGEFLCQREFITEEQLIEALGDHWSNGGTIGAAVRRQGFLDTDEIERQAAAFHSLDTVEI